METERKRKRMEKAEEAVSADAPMRGKEKAEESPPPPTEEEVEEFFAILRRMRVAVKYFEKEGSNRGGGGGDGLKAVADVGGKRAENGAVLDLNALPEPESDRV